MSWRQELDALLPPDRADSAPITHHLRGLLEALHNGQGERPRITITLEADAWTMLEAQFRRPYRPHSSYMLVALDVGTVAFERRKEAAQTCADLAPKWPCEKHGHVGVEGCAGPWMPEEGPASTPAHALHAACDARPAPDAGDWWRCPLRAGHFPASPHADVTGKPWPVQPPTTAPSDAPWPEGPFPRTMMVFVPEGMALEEARRTGKAETLRNPVFADGLVSVKWDDGPGSGPRGQVVDGDKRDRSLGPLGCLEVPGAPPLEPHMAPQTYPPPPKWDASAIEAKAAALAPRDAVTIADEAAGRMPRPEGAIYTAPMTGAEATYGGPWKEPKS